MAAFVSIAGSIGGSPSPTTQHCADLPVTPGQPAGPAMVVQWRVCGRRAQAVARREPAASVALLLPATFPQPERPSILKQSYDMVSRVDARNDSQVIFTIRWCPAACWWLSQRRPLGRAVPIARTRSARL